MRTISLTALIITAVLLSCKQTGNNTVPGNEKILIARDIIYDVVIKIPNKEDPWEIEKLQGYEGDRMISELFNAVYTGRIKAYDYHTGKKLTPDDVRKTELEPGFDRNNIGKIQFTENWFYNPATMEIDKEVISVVLGYENREIDGTLIGYKAAFKLDFN